MSMDVTTNLSVRRSVKCCSRGERNERCKSMQCRKVRNDALGSNRLLQVAMQWRIPILYRLPNRWR